MVHCESHGSTGGLARSNHEEEEEEAPTATPIKMVSCIRLGKHKGKLKQNVTVSHYKKLCRFLYVVVVSSLKETIPF